MREHRNILNMGNGLYSLGASYKLIDRLFKAFELSSGIQQPHMSTENPKSEEEDRMNDIDRRTISETIRDIAMALTGKEIEFIDDDKNK